MASAAQSAMCGLPTDLAVFLAWTDEIGDLDTVLSGLANLDYVYQRLQTYSLRLCLAQYLMCPDDEGPALPDHKAKATAIGEALVRQLFREDGPSRRMQHRHINDTTFHPLFARLKVE